MSTQEWARLARTTIAPILLLVALLVVLAQQHLDLASGFTSPRLVAQGDDVAAFYDEGAAEPAFYVRRSRDGGRAFERPRRAHGELAGAAVTSGTLVTLHHDRASGWFCALQDWPALAPRRWHEPIDDPDLGLERPVHLAALGATPFVFGVDARGALRVARLGQSGALVPLDVALPGAALPERAAEAARTDAPPRVAWATSAAGDERLTLYWRVLDDDAGGPASPGVVRWTTFDGAAFGPLAALGDDLVALAALAEPDGAVTLFGARRAVDASGGEGDAIARWRHAPNGQLEPLERLPYEREGLTRGAGVVSLAACRAGPRTLVLAQIGGAIRLAAREGDAWGPWVDLARMPAEQKAVVYGWGAAMLVLAGLLVAHGLRALLRRRARPRDLDDLLAQARRERRAARERAADEAGRALALGVRGAGPPGPAPARSPDRAEPAPEGADAAPLVERALAFGVDLALVLLAAGALLSTAPEVVARAEVDPRARIALAACVLAGLVAYLALFEALFARTPGKRLLGLEVQDLAGGRPTRGALVVRNLLRIEVLLPPPHLAALLSFLLVLVSAHRQRPGDLVARTTVRRAGARPSPDGDLAPGP